MMDGWKDGWIGLYTAIYLMGVHSGDTSTVKLDLAWGWWATVADSPNLYFFFLDHIRHRAYVQPVSVFLCSL